VIALEGNGHLERVTWRNNQTGQTESLQIAHLFSATGAVPNSSWLGGSVLQVLEVWKTKAVVRWIRFRDGQHHVELWVSQQMPLLDFGMLV